MGEGRSNFRFTPAYLQLLSRLGRFHGTNGSVLAIGANPLWLSQFRLVVLAAARGSAEKPPGLSRAAGCGCCAH